MKHIPSTNNHKPIPNSTFQLTWPHHPLGDLLPYLRLKNFPKNSQGFCSQLVRLQEGWIFLAPHLSLMQDDVSKVDLSSYQYEITSMDTQRAHQLAVENGQERQYLKINELMAS